MATEYSSEAIVAAKSLQTFTYMYASMVTFWTYDYTCSLNEEWTFLLESRWTKVKGLYIVTRYVPFLFFIGHLYMNFTNETPRKCHVMNTMSEALSLISVISSECFFILRTYALWNHNRIVLAAMLFSFFAVIVASVSVLFATTIPAPFQTSAIPGITGCYQDSNIQLFIPFLLLFVLELGLMILTLIRAIQNWRTTNGPLYTVLLKHNIEYYACGLFFSAANILTSLFLHYAYSSLLHNLQLIILAILATRMHLHLWHADRFLRGSDALMFIPMTTGSLALTVE
ncbi:hypothetical protein K503DRAFT_860508 [Rhizopogon vinicolor AM-OR11-026]|uniref:DUF6533 domain-containing protein n=1 Tax=Rhizopogon vinicolor AM-OR11-026 TaxID=1314800 RepID=A0A1B7MHG5_9AGAM|nr:hypothetical protein K503DRAFT_860508 [Rhizopogon vinicolor AM-OR11-026]